MSEIASLGIIQVELEISSKRFSGLGFLLQTDVMYVQVEVTEKNDFRNSSRQLILKTLLRVLCNFITLQTTVARFTK